MLGRLFLLFTLVTLAEIYLLTTIGGALGVGPTVALVALTGFVGAWLARREGRKALASYQEALAKGELPADGIVSGLLILAGGVMLMTPGVLTDAFGLAMMIPPLRRSTAKLVKARLQKRLASGVADGSIKVVSFGSASFGRGPGFGGGGEGGEVVDVEVVDAKGEAGEDTSPARPALHK